MKGKGKGKVEGRKLKKCRTHERTHARPDTKVIFINTLCNAMHCIGQTINQHGKTH